MKAILISIGSGLLFVALGVLLETLRVDGFCRVTGWCYLRALDTYFYAIHPGDVIWALSVINFVLGVTFGMVCYICFSAFRSRTRTPIRAKAGR